MKGKRIKKILISMLLIVSLIVGNLSGFLKWSEFDKSVKASGDMDLSTLEEITWSDFEADVKATLRMDISATATDASITETTIYFYNNTTTGEAGDTSLSCAQTTVKTTGEAQTVEFDLDDFLVDGEFPGFTFIIYGGPAWDSGNTVSVSIGNVYLVTDSKKAVDISGTNWSQPTGELTGTNNWGSWSYSDKWTVSGSVLFSTHRMTLSSPVGLEKEPTVRLKVSATSTDTSISEIQLLLFNNATTGDVASNSDTLACAKTYVSTSGETAILEFPLEDFLVDGAFPGFTFATFSGPAWDSGNTLSLSVEEVALVTEDEQVVDISGASWSQPTSELTGMNNWGSWSYSDKWTVNGMIIFSLHRMTLGAPVNPYEEEEVPLTLNMDVTLSTTDGTTESINVNFFKNSFTGRIDDTPTAARTIPADGSRTSLSFPLEDFLVDGTLPGFMFSILGGPAHDSATEDRSHIKIENVRIEGETVTTIDMSTTSWTNTGLEAANKWGRVSYADGTTTISGMIFTDSHKAVFAQAVNPFEEEEPIVRITASALCESSTYATTNLYFFNNATTGDAASNASSLSCAQATLPTTGERSTIDIPLSELSVDGVFTGFTFAIFNGPAWDSGYTLGIQIEKVQIISDTTVDVDISGATFSQPTGELTGLNNWGSWSANGSTWALKGAILFSLHRMSLSEVVTTEAAEEVELCFDVKASTNDGTTDRLRVLFYNHAHTGSIESYPCVEMYLPADGSVTSVSMNAENFMVDGEVPGFAFGILSGPAHDSSTGDRSNLVFENVQIVGSDYAKDIDMSTATWTEGTDTGITSSNNWGSVSYKNEATTVSGMILYEAQEVTFAEPATTDSIPTLQFDVAASTLDGTTDRIKVYFFNHDYTGSIDGTPHIKRDIPATGEPVKVILPLDAFVTDGELSGFAFGIQNGPEWSSETNDRTTLAFSNVKIVGTAAAQDIDLSTVTWTKGTDTGISGCNNWGRESYSDGTTTVSGMIRFEAHEATFENSIRIDKTLFELHGKDSFESTIFNGDIYLKSGAVFYYGAEETGLAFALTSEGQLSIDATDYSFSNENVKTILEPAYFGLDTFKKTRFNLKIAAKDIATDNSSVQVAIWVNNVLIGGGYFELFVNSEDALPLSNTLLYDTSKVIAYPVLVEGMPETTEPPTDLTELTWEDYGITCIGEISTYTTGALSGKDINNSLFNGDITMQADSHIRYAGSSGDFGLHIKANSSGTLSLLSDTCTLDLDTNEFYPQMYGLTSFVNERFNLKIAVLDMTEMTAKVGVWVNDIILGKYFTLTCTGAYDSTLGSKMSFASGTMQPHSVLAKPKGLTDIRFGDWNSSIYDDGYIYASEFSEGHPTLDTLVGTSLTETIEFTGPTDSSDGNYVLCYGGTKDQTEKMYGLRFALVDDIMKIYGAGSYGLGTFSLTAEVAGIESFVDTQFVWKVDTVKLGNHVLIYMYFDGQLYGGAPFVLADYADMMNDTIVFYPYPAIDGVQSEKPAIVPVAERTLSDLYYNLDDGAYVIPEGLISIQKKVITTENGSSEITWEELNLSEGEKLSEAGDYKIFYSDGYSKYHQEVALYSEGDTKIDDTDSVGSKDLVRLIKHIQAGEDVAYKCEEKAYDVNGDYKVDTNKDTFANTEVACLRKIILGTYKKDTSKVMPIVGHYGPIGATVTDDAYRLIREAGIDQITQYQNHFTTNPASRFEVYEQLSLAQKYGIKLTVNDDSLTEDPTSVTEESVQTAIEKYKDYQSFAGLYLVDEPKTSTYPPNYVMQTYDKALEDHVALAQAVNRQGIFGWANVFGYSYKYVNNRTSQYQYVNYLRTFVSQYEMPFLSHTYYPFWESEQNVGGTVEDSTSYFENLAMVRAVAEEYDIDIWTFVQAGDGFELEPIANNPSRGEFKWNANMGLAFGAKGIQYFPLVQPEFFQNVDDETISSGLLSSTGEKSEWYDYAVEVNAHIKAIDHVLMDATNAGFMATGGYAKSQATDTIDEIKLYSTWFTLKEKLITPIYTSYNGATVTCTDDTYGALTGCFEYGEKHALYIVNYNVTADNTITVDFGENSVDATLIHNATESKESGTSFEITLGAGEAVLVVF